MFDMLDMRDMGGCRDFGLMPPMWLWLVLVRPALTGAPPYPPPPPGVPSPGRHLAAVFGQ
jgi:hypothetical protein